MAPNGLSIIQCRMHRRSVGAASLATSVRVGAFGDSGLAAIHGAAENMVIQHAAHEVSGEDVPVRSESALNFHWLERRNHYRCCKLAVHDEGVAVGPSDERTPEAKGSKTLRSSKATNKSADEGATHKAIRRGHRTRRNAQIHGSTCKDTSGTQRGRRRGARRASTYPNDDYTSSRSLREGEWCWTCSCPTGCRTWGIRRCTRCTRRRRVGSRWRRRRGRIPPRRLESFNGRQYSPDRGSSARGGGGHARQARRACAISRSAAAIRAP